jgi:type II secretory pathway pseudopilin PulG
VLTSFFARPVGPRAGFALIAVIVLVAIIAVVAAVVGPSLARALDQERIAKADRSLLKLDSAIVRFKRTTKTYPGKLNHLATQISTSDKDSCGDNYTGGQVNDWEGSQIDTVGGAYISQPVPAEGLPLAGGLGYARDSLSRNPPGPTGVVEIVMENVPEGDAILLNDRIDGIADYVAGNEVSGNQTGKVRWTVPSAEKTVTLTYNVIPPSAGC